MQISEKDEKFSKLLCPRIPDTSRGRAITRESFHEIVAPVRGIGTKVSFGKRKNTRSVKADNRMVDRRFNAVAAGMHAYAFRPWDSCSMEAATFAVKISGYKVSPIRIIDRSSLCLFVICPTRIAGEC